MKKIQIEEVKNRIQLKQFIGLPETIYKNDGLWVPPLRLLEWADHRKGANAVLSRSKHCHFIAYEDGLPVGRITVYIDPRYNSYHNSTTGMFGSYECLDNDKAASELYSAAENWIKNRDCDRILGPINPIAESWGFLIENPSHPVFMSPHNPIYYNNQILKAGFTRAKDLLVYEADTMKGYKIPDRFIKFTDKILQKRPGLSIRNINRSNLQEDAEHIRTILNAAVAGNWGFVPVEADEMAGIVEKLKLILDERAICFVEDNGRPVAAALGFPDINILLKKFNGRLTPANVLRLLLDRKNIHEYRLWGLAVLPKYQGQGLDVLLYVTLARQLTPFGVRMEANYMLEDNHDILNALDKMGMKEIKKYRVWEKKIKNI